MTLLRPVQMTVAPASPSAAAIPRPAPRVAPATTATRPRRASGAESMGRVSRAASFGLPDFGVQAHTRECDTAAALHRRRNRHRPCRRAAVQTRSTAPARAARSRHGGGHRSDRCLRRGKKPATRSAGDVQRARHRQCAATRIGERPAHHARDLGGTAGRAARGVGRGAEREGRRAGHPREQGAQRLHPLGGRPVRRDRLLGIGDRSALSPGRHRNLRRSGRSHRGAGQDSTRRSSWPTSSRASASYSGACPTRRSPPSGSAWAAG